eukprot:c7364_g2_i2.p1 GENE.c7364_g2_i2~~c7364_g2_i2.p1  ORF type:complete len:167 (+),score=42.17 c7364_g2_i2:494-994(+)
MSTNTHRSTTNCLETLKQNGFRILSTDVNKHAKPIHDIDWSGKVAVVFGNEVSGISDTVRSISDESFYIPMAGFAESFNLSVACAVTVSTIASKRCLSDTPTPFEQDQIMLTWLLRSIRGSSEILERKGISVSDPDNPARLVQTTVRPTESDDDDESGGDVCGESD